MCLCYNFRMAHVGFLSTNKLMTSPHAYEILREYNRLLQRDGKVNRLKFYRDVILPKIPDYDQNSWYGFLNRAYEKTGASNLPLPVPDEQELLKTHQLGELQTALVTNEVATQKGISMALNLGARFYELLLQKFETTPELLTEFEKRVLADSLHKAMKSQDSRIHAIGKVREDGREQAKFERAFRSAAAD